MYARAVFSSAINSSAAAFAATGRLLPLPDGYFRLGGDDWAFGYNFGVLIQPGPNTNIGLTYRSRVQQDFTGTADYIVPAPLNLSSRFRSSSATAKLVLPDTAGISITHRLNADWTLYGDFNWTNWSQFRDLRAFRTDGTLLTSTPQRYRNSFFISIGAAQRLNDKLTLRFGTAFDKTPVIDLYRTARVPDEDRVWLAAGLSYKVVENITLDAGYAHIFVNDSRIRETSATGDVLTGKYRNSVDIISLGARARF
jgi:long-chain fatty acid transport protein